MSTTTTQLKTNSANALDNYDQAVKAARTLNGETLNTRQTAKAPIRDTVAALVENGTPEAAAAITALVDTAEAVSITRDALRSALR